ncbi:hypothetical protein CEP53_013152 [Fusarium sp. AF-6]|nr:hypothetical protein CEP53_013152 [Fusarium sp. AF-6]
MHDLGSYKLFCVTPIGRLDRPGQKYVASLELSPFPTKPFIQLFDNQPFFFFFFHRQTSYLAIFFFF